MASIFIELLFRNFESNPSLIRSSFSLFKSMTACAFRVLLLKKAFTCTIRDKGSNFHFKSWSSQINYLTFFDVLLWNKYFLL